MITDLWTLESGKQYLLISPRTNKFRFFSSADYDRLEVILYSSKTVGQAWYDMIEGYWKPILDQIIGENIRSSLPGCGLYVKLEETHNSPEVALVSTLEKNFNCLDIDALDLNKMYPSAVKEECEIDDFFGNTKFIIDQHIFDYCDTKVYSAESWTLVMMMNAYYQL